MTSIRTAILSLAAAFVACSQGSADEAGALPPGGGGEGETGTASLPIVGPGVRLGMNPATQPGVDVPDWPAAGSATSLYMARIWDMRLSWAQIEPSPPVNGVHTYVWDQLDKRMGQIVAAGMRPMYVLFGTPPWAAPGCDVTNYPHACTTYPTNPDDWSAFVKAVAQRYVNHRTASGEAPVYEVWNEPNLGASSPIAYWTGTDAQLLDLNKRAYQAVKSVAQGALGTVVCCGWNRLAAQNASSPFDRWLDKGGGKYVDAISYHPYPKDWTPSTAAGITGLFREGMARHGVSKALWATEVGFLNGLTGKGKALTYAAQSKLVTETILTLRAESVPVVLWYLWNESHEGFADSDFVGLHRVVADAVKAAQSPPNAPPPAACDAAHPAPQWGVKNGQCLAACGLLGGDAAFEDACAKHGKVDVGAAYDVAFCCKDAPSKTCDPATQPAPKWGEKGGQCLASCDAVGGTSAFETPCAKNGKVDAGQAYDVAYCCRDTPPSAPPSCDPAQQPTPTWGAKGGQCLPACGTIGGTSAFTTPCDKNGKLDAGQAYDVAYCCKDAPMSSVCDPTSQPAPQWGVKNGQCLQGCGLIGGTSAFETPCDKNGKVDAGQAYDVAYCCKDATSSSVCDPVTQPSPQWGVKNGQCLQACGLIGGTSAFTTPCDKNGKVDAGQAYDVDYCCKDATSSSICDPTTQPSPQWGVKNGMCLACCGCIGGTSAFETPCDKNGKVDAGQAHDVAYCCKDPAPVCDPTTQPAPQWGVKNGQCLACCGCIGGTSAFETPCDKNGKVDAGPAYDVAYCCK